MIQNDINYIIISHNKNIYKNYYYKSSKIYYKSSKYVFFCHDLSKTIKNDK